MRHGSSIARAIAFTALVALTLPARADAATPWWVPRLRDKQIAGDDTEKGGGDTLSATPATIPAPPPIPSSSLLKTIKRLRGSEIGKEPNSVAYLNVIESGKATPAQVNDFAAYLAKRGAPKVALQFQQYATELAPEQTTLWLNLGTIELTLGNLSASTGAFKKAIAQDPNNGLAHYNLGAVYDADKDYDDAIEQYRIALVLDPGLADPRKNPQVVNNENMLAVQVKLYQNKAGALGLPLLQMQPPPDPTKTPAPAPASAATPEKK